MNSMCTFVQTSTVLAHQTLGQKGVGECSKSIEMCMSLNCRIFLWYMWLCLNMSGKPNLMPVFTSFAWNLPNAFKALNWSRSTASAKHRDHVYRVSSPWGLWGRWQLLDDSPLLRWFGHSNRYKHLKTFISSGFQITTFDYQRVWSISKGPKPKWLWIGQWPWGQPSNLLKPGPPWTIDVVA
jgi:hypothetical protein